MRPVRLDDPSVPARLRTDHPRYRREAPIPATLRESLRETLASDAALPGSADSEPP